MSWDWPTEEERDAVMFENTYANYREWLTRLSDRVASSREVVLAEARDRGIDPLALLKDKMARLVP